MKTVTDCAFERRDDCIYNTMYNARAYLCISIMYLCVYSYTMVVYRVVDHTRLPSPCSGNQNASSDETRTIYFEMTK